MSTEQWVVFWMLITLLVVNFLLNVAKKPNDVLNFACHLVIDGGFALAVCYLAGVI